MPTPRPLRMSSKRFNLRSHDAMTVAHGIGGLVSLTWSGNKRVLDFMIAVYNHGCSDF